MDVNKLAYKIVQQSIGEEPSKKPNPRASKRGLARKKALTPEQRSDIAKKGADKRWEKKHLAKIRTDG